MAKWASAACLEEASAAAAAGQDQTFTPQHVAKLRSVTAAEISPDGTRVAYVLSVPRQPLKEDDGAAWAELHVVGADGVSRPFAAGQVNVSAVAWTPDGRMVWVSSGDRNELALYRTRTLEVVARPPADWPPQHVTFRGARAYVTSGWNGSLRVYGSDGRSLRRTIVPVGSYNVQQADGWVVTPGLGTGSLCILNPRGRLLRRERIARSSHDACIVHVG